MTGTGLLAAADSAGGVQAGRSTAATGDTGAIVRTAVRDLAPADLTGVTLVHEHLGDGTAGTDPATAPTQDAVWMAAELRAAAAAGVHCVVAAQPELPPARTLDYLIELSRRSGVHIVPAGGLLMLARYPDAVRTAGEEELAELLVRAADAGRFGVFGENGVTNGAADLAPEEKRVFRALGRAQASTGLPILTHNNYSTGPHVAPEIGLWQLDLLEAGGAEPRACAIGHVCCLADPGTRVARALARRGAFVAFDRLSRQEQWVSDQDRIVAIRALLDAGYEDRILFSSDYGGTLNAATGERNSYTGPLHARDGGPGYARVVSLFLPKLRRAGVDEATIRRITIDNPRRFLAFVPRDARRSEPK